MQHELQPLLQNMPYMQRINEKNYTKNVKSFCEIFLLKSENRAISLKSLKYLQVTFYPDIIFTIERHMNLQIFKNIFHQTFRHIILFFTYNAFFRFKKIYIYKIYIYIYIYNCFMFSSYSISNEYFLGGAIICIAFFH